MRIACVLAEGFEDSEFQKPYDAFRAAGHEVTIVGLECEKLAGKKGKATAKVDRAIDEVRASQFDALFIPGGHSPDRLRADDRMVSFTRAFRDKPIFAICHGPQLLITAGMARGRTMTAWKTIQVDLQYAGANVLDEEVFVDRSLVTSRQPEDLPAFIRESLALLEAAPTAHV